MSNLSRLEAVSDALDTAISTANSLPEAGGGGGGVETFNITINEFAASAGFSYLVDEENFATAPSAGTYPAFNGVCLVNCLYPMIESAADKGCAMNQIGSISIFKFNGDATLYAIP